MTSIAAPFPTAAASRTGLRIGQTLSGLAVLFLLLDGAMKLAAVQPVVDATAALGWPTDVTTLRTLGVLTLGGALLYAVPRTAVIGTILLTGYLGGAVATHARIGSPLFTHTLFAVYVGAVLWLGLYLRDARVRALFDR